MLIMIDLVPHSPVKHLPTWLPIAGFKRHALKARADLKAWRETGVNMVMSAQVKTYCVKWADTLES